MIDYSPFWETLKNSSETTYTLINKYHISSAIIDKLRKNKPMNTTTLNDLCRILDCQLQDIAQYIPSDEDQPLQGGIENILRIKVPYMQQGYFWKIVKK